MSLLEDINFYINICSAFGLVIAFYSYYVKIKYLRDPGQYRALCDINNKMSCSKVITSRYGSGFGIVGKLFGENSSLNVSNSLLGGVFYALQIIF
ncbi:vitamin K epoxide reductase complex subunit 1 1, partial [Brachionus plicatilis]